MIHSEVSALYQAHGYKFYDKGAYNVNLFGIRSATVTDAFDDILGVAYEDDFGNKIVLEHKGTTDPGAYWLGSKMGNAEGTAILVPGQYPKCWALGDHKGYEALVQQGNPFKVWRDKNKDGKIDTGGKIYTDATGLNMHTTSFLSEIDKVGAYSAGCQVRKMDEDHLMVMQVIRRSIQHYGNRFTYTLFDLR